ALRRDEVREAEVALRLRALGLRLLLAQHREARDLTLAHVVLVEDDVLAVARGRPVAVDAASADELLGDDAIEQALARLEEIARRLALLGVLEDLREAAGELPGREEERPV